MPEAGLWNGRTSIEWTRNAAGSRYRMPPVPHMPIVVSEEPGNATSTAGRIGQARFADGGSAAVRQMGGDRQPLRLPRAVERGEAGAVLVVPAGEPLRSRLRTARADPKTIPAVVAQGRCR
jgi:hypothetical protein